MQVIDKSNLMIAIITIIICMIIFLKLSVNNSQVCGLGLDTSDQDILDPQNLYQSVQTL